MIEIGRTSNLQVVKETEFGFYLDAENLGEILLPSKHAPDNLSIDDTVEVFLYLDSEDRPIATTQTPKAEVGEFAYLEATDNTQIGAFLDWGFLGQPEPPVIFEWDCQPTVIRSGRMARPLDGRPF